MSTRFSFNETGYHSVQAPIIASGNNCFVNLKITRELVIPSGAVSGYVLKSNAGGTGVWTQEVATISPMVGVNLDFNGTNYQTITVTGSTTFTASNHAIGKEVSMKILCDGTARALSFPAWIFIGSPAPTGIDANKTAILSATSFSTNDANVVVAYSVQQ